MEPLATNRLRILARCFFVWALLIILRLLEIQIWDHEYYERYAQSQHERETEIRAPRGAIFDRNGEHLAMSLQVDSVFINPLLLPDPAVAAGLLSGVLDDIDRTDLLSRIESARRRRRGFLWVKRRISQEESSRIRSYGLDWIGFQPESRRFYPKNELAAQLIGSVDHREKGNGGLELSFNQELEGRAGMVRTRADVLRNVFERDVFTDPDPGKAITLTIDERIQYVAERELAKAAREHRCKTGSVVVMDPKSGEIYAMASYPGFDPNTPPAHGESLAPRVNLAISSPFEPGSIFKVITLAAALEETRLRPGSMFHCGNGRMTLFRRVIHDHKPHGMLSMSQILAKSSNIGTIKIALEVGDERMHEYVRRFGFGESTGLPLPAESSGVVRRLEKWIPSSIGSIAMGHELSTTSVQLAQACSVIANGGMLVKPRVTLKAQREGEEPELFESAKDPIRIIKPETAITMRRMMEGAVLKGTGTLAQLEGYTSGGKTGSAQIYDFRARTYTHKYNSSFMGFAPVNNPAVVIVVTLHGASRYGGIVAAPVFQSVTTAALRFLGVPKDLPDGVRPSGGGYAPVEDLAIADLGGAPPGAEEEEELAATYPLIVAAQQADEKQPEDVAPVPASLTAGPTVPDFTGKSLRAVLEESSALGIKVEFAGSGIARAQHPEPGAVLRPKERVRVQFDR